VIVNKPTPDFHKADHRCRENDDHRNSNFHPVDLPDFGGLSKT
jgi:hypothetical protein